MRTAGLLTLGLIIAASCVLQADKAMAADSYLLVKVADMDRRVNYQVMSAVEFKDFEKTLQTEKKFYQDALRNAAKAWREDEFNKGITFPAGRLVPRSIVGSPERFPTKEKAEEQYNRYYEREAEKESRLRDRDKGKKKSKEEIERETKKESETSRALELLTDKLVELTGVKIESPAAPAALGDEKKVDEKKVDEKKVDEKKGDDKKPGEKKADEKADAVKAGLKAL
jgi:hypothetical protein